MGPKHKTNFKEGDRINDCFTLIRNYSRPTTEKGKNEWLWECKCDCGEIFHVREYKILNRYGCHSCTNKKTSTETALKKKNGITHYGLKNRLYKDYKYGASKRCIDFNISFDDFVNLMEQDCYYCGESPVLHEGELQYMQKTIEPWKHNGIDRVNSNIGYENGNVVPCCSKCNYAKHDLTKDEFYKWIVQIYNHLVETQNIKKNTIVEQSKISNEDNKETPIDYPQFHIYRNGKKKNV